jgi:hypothetical protein
MPAAPPRMRNAAAGMASDFRSTVVTLHSVMVSHVDR